MHFRLYLTALFGCFLGVVTLIFISIFTNITQENQLINSYFKSETSEKNHASSVWCLKRLDGSKVYSFQNLYYLPQHKGYLFFYLNKHSVVSGIESPTSLKQICLSTIKNHAGFYLKLVIVKSSTYLLQQNITYLDNNMIIMKRFKPDNIMHVIHDDLLPLFLTFQELCKNNIYLCVSSYQLLFFDDNDGGPYYEWYTNFSKKDPLFLPTLSIAVCFRNSIIGLSQESVWFQYGFKNVQGPLKNPIINGLKLRQFAKFVKEQFGIKIEGLKFLNTEKPKSIVFLNRKLNRKILNSYIIEEHIIKVHKNVYKQPVNIINVDLSTNTSKEIISALQMTNIFIGMHGSAMILALFLPPGSYIFELFPFGIQPEFVSPVRALCLLPNVYYNYKSWVNNNESNTRTHPEHLPLHGGIFHLPAPQQENIMHIKLVPPVECCHNPVYLFRMFQDTLVDDSFLSLLSPVIINNITNTSEQKISKKDEAYVYRLWYFPPPVFNLSCKCIGTFLKVSWNFPISTLSNVKFSVATSTGVILVTESLYFQTEIGNCNIDQNDSLKQYPVSVWVKTLEGELESIDSYTECNHVGKNVEEGVL